MTLLTKRSAAYIATEQWELGKADWLGMTEQQPDQFQQAFEGFRTAEQSGVAAKFSQGLIEENQTIRYSG